MDRDRQTDGIAYQYRASYYTTRDENGPFIGIELLDTGVNNHVLQ